MMKSSLTYQDLSRAICGFFSLIRFDDLKVFSCPSCGNSPKYIVADGKSDGPVKKRVSKLKFNNTKYISHAKP